MAEYCRLTQIALFTMKPEVGTSDSFCLMHQWLRRRRCAHQANLVVGDVPFASGFKPFFHGSQTHITNRSRLGLCAISTGEYRRANGRLSLWCNEPIQIDRFALGKSLTQVVHDGA